MIVIPDESAYTADEIRYPGVLNVSGFRISTLGGFRNDGICDFDRNA